jgi:hypothetical protein
LKLVGKLIETNFGQVLVLLVADFAAEDAAVLDQVLPERVVSAEQLATQGTRPLFQVAI